MRTAIIYTGAMRAFDRCIETHNWHVLRHLGEVDFYVSTYKDGTEAQAEILRARFPKSRVEIEVMDSQPDCISDLRAKGVPLPERWKEGKNYTHEPYAISVHPQAVLRQLWQLEKGWELFERTAPATMTTEKNVPNYDCVVRCRPDLFFHSSKFRIEKMPLDVALTPWWGRFGGIADRFAILGLVAAEVYFHTYSIVWELMAIGCPLHPESLIYAAMTTVKLPVIDTLRVEFSTMRANGQTRAPEISASDIAHLAASR